MTAIVVFFVGVAFGYLLDYYSMPRDIRKLRKEIDELTNKNLDLQDRLLEIEENERQAD